MLRMPPSLISSWWRRNVRQVEVHAQPIFLDAQSFVHADVEDLSRGDIARHQVAVLRIALFQEVVALVLGNLLGLAGVLRLARHPHPAAFAASAFAHQSELVGAGNGGRMDLDELGVAVFRAGLEGAAGGAAGADHRHRRAAVNQSAAARGDDHRVGREGADLHRDQVLADNARGRCRWHRARGPGSPRLRKS